MKYNNLLFTFLFLFVQNTYAEYRAYQYYVKSKYNIKIDTKPYVVVSSLDPISYVAYHGGSDSIEVDLIRSWDCPGNTGQSGSLCDAPLGDPKRKLSSKE